MIVNLLRILRLIYYNIYICYESTQQILGLFFFSSPCRAHSLGVSFFLSEKVSFSFSVYPTLIASFCHGLFVYFIHFIYIKILPHSHSLRLSLTFLTFPLLRYLFDISKGSGTRKRTHRERERDSHTHTHTST